jgi:hypothetical protein
VLDGKGNVGHGWQGQGSATFSGLRQEHKAGRCAVFAIPRPPRIAC